MTFSLPSENELLPEWNCDPEIFRLIQELKKIFTRKQKEKNEAGEENGLKKLCEGTVN